MPSGEKEWIAIAERQLLGRKIVGVLYLDHDTAAKLGWTSRPIVLRLDDGNLIYPSRDDEGNDGGALFTNDEEHPTLPVMRD